MIDNMKKGICSLRLEKMSKVYNKKGEIDPTLVRATFSILDFNVSGNKQIVSKKVALEGKDTLLYKPLVCNYIPTTDYDTPNDDFTDHCEKTITLRNGEEYIGSGTIPIGVCENVDVGVVTDDNGNEVDCLIADFLLWLYRFPNEISLINDFYENGETLYTSCEHYYKSDEIDDEGNEVVSKLILDGHCVLGRNIEPAYTTSKLIAFNQSWNKALNNIKNKQNNNREGKVLEKNNVMFEMLKSNNAISSASYRYRIYSALEKVMMAEEYNNMYISEYDIYPTEEYFLYETYTSSEGKYKYYKITFKVDENDTITVDFDNKQEVEYKYTLQVVENDETKKSLNAKEVELEEKEKEIETLNSSLNSKDKEIGEIQEKLEKANDLALSLNEKVGELEKELEEVKPIVEEYNAEKFEKALNEAKEIYREKFEKVNALEVFEEETTQDLISKSINSKTDEFKNQLNQLLIDNIKLETKKDNEVEPMVKSINSIVKGDVTRGLVPSDSSVYEDLCGVKVD